MDCVDVIFCVPKHLHTTTLVMICFVKPSLTFVNGNHLTPIVDCVELSPTSLLRKVLCL